MDDDSENEGLSSQQLKQQESPRRAVGSDDEDDDLEEGEATARPSKRRPGLYSDDEEDDDEEDDDDGEMTEADRKFIVDDEEEENDIARRKKRSKKKKRRRGSDDEEDSNQEEAPRQEAEEDDLEEDDLDLINENIGLSNKKVFKRLRKKLDDSDEPRDLSQLFRDEDDTMEDGQNRGSRGFDSRELYERDDDDDLDDFIIDDDEGEGRVSRKERIRQRKEKLDTAANRGFNYGVSDEAWAEINELFGDSAEYEYAMYYDPENGQMELGTEDSAENNIVNLEDGEEVVTRKSKEVRLKDVYEPAVIAQRMLTEEDEIIRMTDIPERYQIDRKNFPPPDESQLARESLYIARELIKGSKAIDESLLMSQDNPLVKAVYEILRFIRHENLEIPFIAVHRKDYYSPTLSASDLWRVYELDEKFLQIEVKKRALRQTFEDLAAVSEDARMDDYAALHIDKAQHLDDIADMQTYLQLHYALQQAMLDQAKPRMYKKPVWRVAYEGAKRNGLDAFGKMFGINSQKYSQSLVSRNPLHFPEDSLSAPLEAAKEFVCTLFPTPEKVLQATRETLALEIAADPVLRDFMRRVYLTDAVVTVSPTPKGRSVIKPSHKYYPFKYMTSKSVMDFKDGQFLEIIAAENEGLVTISAKVDMEDELLEDMKKNIKNDYYSVNAKLWNTERELVAVHVARGILFDQTVKWLKERLRQSAIEYVSNMCKIKLEQKLDVAPYKAPQDDEEFVDDTPPMVMALSWGQGDRTSATHGVIVDSAGRLTYQFVCPKLGDREREADMDQFAAKIALYEPDVIVLAGFHPGIKTHLLAIVKDIVQKGRAKRKWSKDIGTMIVDDDVARIFMNSNRGIKYYPDASFTPLQRYLVSLARKAQDPITEYAGLMNSDDDIKHIQLHPLQSLLPDEKLKKALEVSFMNVVANCGVDINLCGSNEELSGCLQFISGLGPRKANAMLTKINRMGGKLQNRSDLIIKRLCSQKVFINCASFIRIKERHFTKTPNFTIDPLDDTRIHPEDYDIARKMAADALDLDDDAVDQDNPSQHVIDIMENESDRLLMLMLDDYADELERSDHKLKKIALNEMRDELMAPYLEKRRKFESATEDEIFTMLTSETSETLHAGSLVNVTVLRAKDRFIFCQHTSGMEAIVHVKNVDIPPQMEADPQLHMLFVPGSVIPARVIEVNKTRLSLELDIRKNAILDRTHDVTLRDPSFSMEREEQDMFHNTVVSKKKGGNQGRSITHPFFKNIDFKGAEEYLSRRPRGEIVVRPSTKGNDHISITWKVENDIYQHIDVKEKQKENEWTLGKILCIENREFLEIDQIIAEHIEPMTRRIAEIIDHSKFQKKSKDDMFKYIEEQARYFNRSVYGFILSSDKPGSFQLVYKHPGNRTKAEVITVFPDGFVFRLRKFRDVDSVLKFFKADEAAKSTRPSGNSSSGVAPPSRSARPSTAHRSSSSSNNHQQQRQSSHSNPSRPASQGFSSAPRDPDPSASAGLQMHPSRLAHLEQGQQQSSSERDAVKKEDSAVGGWGTATTNGSGGGW